MERVAYAPTDPEAVWNLFPEYSGRLAFDIGAHFGEVSDILAEHFDRVVACEPLPEAYALLMQSKKNVTVIPEAVTDHQGRVELMLGVKPFPMFVTGNSLYWQATSGASVVATTVDALRRDFGDPDFIKIDTEGHEVAVLRGAQETLKFVHPRLLVEVHSEQNLADCRELLAGYTVELIRHPHYQPDSYHYLNHLFLRCE